ncbi:MAG: hypothetical protein M5U26_06895 [Planctomycetota bacterium]|nr:hypothetical protein [Planctomycetota bacterium]
MLDFDSFGLEHVILDDLHPPRKVLDLLPPATCRSLCVAPIDVFDGVLTLAVSSLEVLSRLDALRYELNVQIEPVHATREEILCALARWYP